MWRNTTDTKRDQKLAGSGVLVFFLDSDKKGERVHTRKPLLQHTEIFINLDSSFTFTSITLALIAQMHLTMVNELRIPLTPAFKRVRIIPLTP